MNRNEFHPDGPSPLTLAAYADGRLDPAECEALEAHLAECGRCLDAVRDAARMRAGDATPTTLPGPAVVAAAQQLVAGDQNDGTQPAVSAWRPTWQFTGRWAAAAVAAMVIGVLGWRFGSDAAPVPEIESEEAIVAAMSFGVFADTQATGMVDLSFPAYSEVTR